MGRKKSEKASHSLSRCDQFLSPGIASPESCERSTSNGGKPCNESETSPKCKREAEKSSYQGPSPKRRACVQEKQGSPLKRGMENPIKQNGHENQGCHRVPDARFSVLPKSPRKKLSNLFPQTPNWNPKDPAQLQLVKTALHVSMAPGLMICREEEQDKIFGFCQDCINQEKAGSLYISGCPGTGKTLLMEKMKDLSGVWAKDAGHSPPDLFAINCTSLAKTSDIFNKILDKHQGRKKLNSSCSPLQQLQKLFSSKQNSSAGKMMLMIIDEMDYLITRDRSVLHDLFMLTTLPFSRCILIGIANALDLTDRFLPKLNSLNCKPAVVTFRAYSKDQILKILQQRLMAFPYTVFQPQALELCARKVAAASGDMRKALHSCWGAIEMLEAELRESISNLSSFSNEKPLVVQPVARARESLTEQEINIVRIDHMVNALSKMFKSIIVDTIQSLPQHQQIILCSSVKLFRQGNKDTTLGKLNKFYSDFCKSALIHPASMTEFSNMCRVLNDQGLLKLGQSREDRLRRVALKVDEADITFALQGIRFFRNCLQ
ncbi:cell division control protein 6 homolog B [Amborella trichopoda]|uniref:Cell division control protein n=1 Tax=Amborella trichopoda TaxID=13333 RepID=W1PPV7_AMBTC|nr:cell division control protein 6 homolog B [Amborella trichopoda]ERN09736.1 hypothetical protein AMTR_s00029p00230900 [Amborella trichopoda]|eukprot:XP_020524903.1 cell division control protein 6 homolog B [Amborella trichopoda]